MYFGNGTCSFRSRLGHEDGCGGCDGIVLWPLEGIDAVALCEEGGSHF